MPVERPGQPRQREQEQGPLQPDREGDAQVVEELAADTMSPEDLPVLHHWDLGYDTDSARAIDVATAANHLTLVNAPTLGTTGHRFTGLQLSPAGAPEQYGTGNTR